MSKWFSSILLLSSGIVTSKLSGWGPSDYTVPALQSPPPPPITETTFPLNADQEWFVKPSLLVWRPFQDEIDSGFTLAFPSTSPIVAKDKTQNVNFDWGAGARLTIGKYLPHHEQWDVTLATTYFYSDTQKTIKGKGLPDSLASIMLEGVKVIENGWNPSILGLSTQTKLNWQVNYFTWDLTVGRLYNLTPKVVLHPYLSIRTMLIFENYLNRNTSLSVNSQGGLFPANTKFKADNSIWGMGPRIGSDFAFYFGRGWSIAAGLSGSIVMGQYHISERVNGFTLVDASHPNVPTALKISDRDTVMRANLEGNIGLGWEKWVRNRTVRIAPSFMFEVTQWYMINNWAATNLPNTTGMPDFGMFSARRMGDLGFLGFTINLQVDF